ncbi:ArsR family transcriptional regulator [Pseudoalteromonas sp. ASV78]|uniref:ArsR family transcriptional regulator n=1 Tax=Pseudoalteromonas sp. ASV78 TaxID=3397851 RepID=UPI0039FD2EB1
MKVSNPLTIIAIFAGLAEALATIALLGLPQELQEIFLYFVMAFPTLIVIFFFVVLYFKNTVLYAPGDFQVPEHYLKINMIDIKQALTSELSKSAKNLIKDGGHVNDKVSLATESTELARKSIDIAQEVTEELLSPSLELLMLQLLEKPREERERIIDSIESSRLKEMLVSMMERIKSKVGEDTFNKSMQPTAKASTD